MKARVKATGELIEIMQVYEKGESFYVRLDILNTSEVRYHISELEFEGFETEGKFAETCLNGIKQGADYIPDYWTRLEHQYAGMAIQGMLNNSLLITGLLKVNKSHEDIVDEVTGTAIRYAHALIQKLKEKEERK